MKNNQLENEREKRKGKPLEKWIKKGRCSEECYKTKSFGSEMIEEGEQNNTRNIICKFYYIRTFQFTYEIYICVIIQLYFCQYQ
jgi:hypothetical protein